MERIEKDFEVEMKWLCQESMMNGGVEWRRLIGLFCPSVSLSCVRGITINV